MKASKTKTSISLSEDSSSSDTHKIIDMAVEEKYSSSVPLK